MNEPLTLEQLREMEGKLAWIVPIEEQDWKAHWAIRRYNRFSADSKTMKGTMYFLYERDYGKTWIAYSYSPAHIDREAWEGCEHCKNDSMNGEGNSHDFRVSEAAIYYYDSEFGWEGVDADYCPWCGRPLTEEA